MSTRHGARLRRLVINGAVLLGVTIALLVVLEAGFRLRAYLADSKILSASVVRRPRLAPGASADLVDIIRLSPNERIIYELIPDLHVTYRDAVLSINRHGFRGRNIDVKKPPSGIRVVGLGDSIMFGWGVDDDRDYLSVFARLLEKRHTNVSWEVVNTAVPGYNTVMEVETLKAKGLRFDPDLVVLGFCGNDMNLPYFIREREEYLTLRKSFLAQFVAERLAGRPANASSSDDDTGLTRWTAPNREAWDGFDSSEGYNVPPRYADMVGLSAFSRAMRELRLLSEEHGFDVAVVYFPTARRRAAQIAKDQGFLNVNLRFTVANYMSAHNLESFAGSALTLSADDPHPSVLGHQMIAEALFEAVIREGWTTKYVQRAAASSRPEQE